MEITAMTSDWAALLQDALKCDDEIVPDGWDSAETIAAKIGKSLSHTGKLLSDATRKGAIECRKFRITTGMVRRPVAHYREIPR
jgi:hypothetical protein